MKTSSAFDSAMTPWSAGWSSTDLPPARESRSSIFDEPRYEFTKRMELSYDQHVELKALAEEKGMLFFSSPFSTRRR